MTDHKYITIAELEEKAPNFVKVLKRNLSEKQIEFFLQPRHQVMKIKIRKANAGPVNANRPIWFKQHTNYTPWGEGLYIIYVHNSIIRGLQHTPAYGELMALRLLGHMRFHEI